MLILKSIVIPTFLFQCSNIYVPDAFINQVNHKIYKFLWNDKPAKRKNETVISEIQESGIKMPHIPTVVKSLKMMWIKCLLDPQITGRWKQLTWYLMNVNKFELMCKFDSKFVNPLTPFYQQLLEYW